MQGPLNYTWNRSRCTSLSKFTTNRGEPAADHVLTSSENEFGHGNERRCKSSPRSRRPRGRGIWTRTYDPQKSGKPTRSLLEVVVLLATGDASAERLPGLAKGAISTEIMALKEAHATEVRALKKEHLPTLKHATFEEQRKHQDKRQEAIAHLKEALEQAKKTPAEAHVEI